jgi:hypothetical protein
VPNPNIRNCVQICRLVKNEPDIEMAIADEIQNFKEYGMPQFTVLGKDRRLGRDEKAK